MQRFALIPRLGLLLLALLTGLHAQDRVDFANLVQEVDLLRQEVGQLRLELEQVQRENTQLREEVRVSFERQQQLAEYYSQLLGELENRVGVVRTEFKKANAKLKEELIESVTAQLTQFAEDTRKAFADVQAPTTGGGGGSSTKRNEPDKPFVDDFPKTGIEYKVKSGDNLWKLARTYQSTVDWIRSANRLTKASELHVGQVLFIPQKAN